jgi:hypothetical protein
MKSCFFENIGETDDSLVELTRDGRRKRERRHKLQIAEI